MGLLHRQKKHLYPLTTILGDQIAYGGGIINLEIGPIRTIQRSIGLQVRSILRILNSAKCDSKLSWYSTKSERHTKRLSEA